MRFLLCLALLTATAFAQRSAEVMASRGAYYDETGIGTLASAYQVGPAETNFGRAFTVIDFPLTSAALGGSVDSIQALALRLTKVVPDVPVGGRIQVWLASNTTRALNQPPEKFNLARIPSGIDPTSTGPFGQLVLVGTASVGTGPDGIVDRLGFSLTAEASTLAAAQIRQGSLRLVITAADNTTALAWAAQGVNAPRLTATPGPLLAATDALDPFVGTWIIGSESAANDATVITFLEDGRYFAVVDGADGNANSPDRDGIEAGTYRYDPASGDLVVYAATNSDGTSGLSGLGTMRVSFFASRVSLSSTAGSRQLERVESSTDALVGAWLAESTVSGIAETYLFIATPSRRFFALQLGGPYGNGSTGWERGTYTWLSSNGSFKPTVTADTNGNWGFSHELPNQTVRIEGDVLFFRATGTGSSETSYTLRRVTASSASNRLINLSVRADLGVTATAHTLGFVLQGTGTKPILARVAGPSLAALNVTNANPDPAGVLFKKGVLHAANDDWSGTAELQAAFDRAGAFAYSSTASKDAAILAELGTGEYTLQGVGTNGAVGNVVLEIYDASPRADLDKSTSRILNLSALLHLQANTVAEVGFVLAGTGPKTVLIRAVGPSLVQFQVDTPMIDPTLALNRSAFGYGNDNWSGALPLRDAMKQVGAFDLPDTSKDAAVLVTLEAGPHTVRVQDVNNREGRVLVEVYELQ